MKLTVEKNPDIHRLSSYFKKIEALADKMGVDVDDLIHDQKRKSGMYTSFKKNILSIAQRRTEMLSKKRNQSGDDIEKSTVGLTIITSRKN